MLSEKPELDIETALRMNLEIESVDAGTVIKQAVESVDWEVCGVPSGGQRGELRQQERMKTLVKGGRGRRED